MTCRKWVVRGVVFAAAGVLTAGAVAYQHWTSPATVRRLVLDKVGAKFPGAVVTAESTSMRLLGGILVRELRMARRDDADSTSFLYVPSAVIYHDKEQILEGKLAVRKVELERPTLRVWRGRDGRLSINDLICPPNPDERLPTIVVSHATVVVEDRMAPAGTPPLEIKDVSFTMINDPEPMVAFEGSGESDLGPVKVDGHWNRRTGGVGLALHATAVPLGPSLVRRLDGLSPETAEHLRDLSGVGKVDAALTYRPGHARPLGYDVTLSLAKGRFTHRELPLPLEDVEASLRCVDGRVPKAELNARAGKATVTATLRDVALPWCRDGACGTVLDMLHDLDVKVDGLEVNEALFDAPYLKRVKDDVYNRFQPSGPLTATVQVRPEGREPWRLRLLLEPRAMTATYCKFIYTLERVAGTIEFQSGGARGEVWEVDLTGHSGERPVRIKGNLTGTPPRHNADIDVWGENIPLDKKLLYALDELSKREEGRTHFGNLARSFSPSGLGDFHFHARRDPAADKYLNHYVIRFHDAAASYKEFPLRFEGLSGILEIRPDLSWEFRDFVGRHGDTVFRTRGGSKRREDGITVEIHGRNVALDEDLRKAILKPDMQAVWKKFAPAGRIDCDGTIRIPPSPPDAEAKPDIDLTVQARGCSVKPEFFKYELRDLRGTVHYFRNSVEFDNLSARHDATTVRIDRGVVLLRPESGGFTADLTYLHADGVRGDEDFVRALREVREVLGKAWRTLDVQGPVELHTRLYLDVAARDEPPRIFWDGALVLRGASLRAGVPLEHVTGTIATRGWFNGSRLDGVDGNLDLRELTVFNQPMKNVRGELLVTEDEPDVLKLPGLMASYLGGQVYGPARVEFGPLLRYELNLTASQVRLEEFARHNFQGKAEAPEMNGLAVARLYLRGEGPELAGLRGSGRLDVPSGKMANLPPVVDLLKFLGLRLPDRTAFEEAHAAFDIDGARAHVRRLELFGNAISLRGQGDVNLDGSDIALDLNADWARLGQVLPPGLRAIPREISNQLFKVEVRGRLDDLRFNKQPLPLLTDPLRRLLTGDDEAKDRKKGAI